MTEKRQQLLVAEPGRKAKKPKKHTVVCPKCHVPMNLRRGQYGIFYGCRNWPECGMIHSSAHDGTPMGKASTQKTRSLRVSAHEALDSLWKGRGSRMTRGQAYTWLTKKMGRGKLTHISEMEEGDLRQVISTCLERSMMR